MSELPKDLVFKVNYLGGDMPTFALNFSRPGNQVIAQYYNLLRLGREGYRRIQQAGQDTAMYLSHELEKLGPFELLTDGSDLPVFTFKIKDGATDKYSVFDISDKVRERGWLIPAYTFPENLEDIAVLRIVIKEGFSRDMADLLLEDMKRIIAHCENYPGRIAKPAPQKGKVRKHC